MLILVVDDHAKVLKFVEIDLRLRRFQVIPQLPVRKP
jgi:hypothetical protein